MRIRTKLTLQFALIVAGILVLSAIAVFFFSASHREDDFYSRLKERGLTTARLLINVDEVDQNLLKIIGRSSFFLPREQIVIYDYLNKELFRSSDTLPVNFSEKLLNKIRLEKQVKFEKDRRQHIGFVYTDDYNRVVVIASAEDVYGWRKLDNLKIILLAVSIVSVAITLFAGWFFAGAALRPIAEVVKEVDQITASNLDSRVMEGNGTDEIAHLARTFNNMLERLEEAFDMQKSFVSNASHEMRTPLTALTGQIEVTLIKERDVKEYQAILQSLLEDIKSLNDLTNGLLDLAQISMSNSYSGLNKIRIDEVLWQARAELERRNMSKGYRVNIQFDELLEDESLLVLTGNDQLLKTAFLNLLDNACKYSDNKHVTVFVGWKNGNIRLRFTDTGIGISPEELNKIFEPFYRAKNVRYVKGHGLGLSLTQKIIAIHGGSMQIKSVHGKGTTVEVSLPPSP